MVNSITDPANAVACSSSGAGLCVGPRMKLPSAVAGGTAPSESCLAGTKPRVRGSRVGGVGRSVGGAGVSVWQAAVASAQERKRVTTGSDGKFLDSDMRVVAHCSLLLA